MKLSSVSCHDSARRAGTNAAVEPSTATSTVPDGAAGFEFGRLSGAASCMGRASTRLPGSGFAVPPELRN